MYETLACVAAYLIGAIPFGVIVARAKGVNIFAEGSGNCGATNVGRVLGKKYGFLVFALDFLKGAAPAYAAVYWRESVDWTAVGVGLFAVLGHLYPVFLRFRGGKGVATGAGIVAVLLPLPFALAALTFVAAIVASSTMSIASTTAALVLPLAHASQAKSASVASLVLSIMVMVLVVAKHIPNLRRLENGTEPRLRSLVRFRKWAYGLHVTALGIWCGASGFFTLAVTPAVFAAMKQLVDEPPDWLRLVVSGEELGSHLAGAAVAPVFPAYFLVSALCAAVAFGTTRGWVALLRTKREQWRQTLIVLAAVCVSHGWWTVQELNELRPKRFSIDPIVRAEARATFSQKHAVSMAENLGTILLLCPTLILAGYLPRDDEFVLRHDVSS